MIAKGDMLKALRQKEMDYTMLMLGTQLHNIDNMIPDHNARINQLSELLQTRAEEVCGSHASSSSLEPLGFPGYFVLRCLPENENADYEIRKAYSCYVCKAQGGCSIK